MPKKGISTTKKCSKCKKQSISGLKQHIGLCKYHYLEYQYGTAWAKKCMEQEKE